MTKPRSPSAALRVEISRCRSLLNALEDNDFPDDTRRLLAVGLVTDAKNALKAAQTCLLPDVRPTKGRY